MNIARLGIKGKGSRVTAYYINSRILEDLRAAKPSDALYEGNPFSLVANLALDQQRVAHGFCIYRTEDFTCSLQINGKENPIEVIGYLDDGFTFEEVFNTEKSKSLLAHYEDLEPLTEQRPIASRQMLIIEVEEFKMAEMSVQISSRRKIMLRDVNLGLIDLDYDTELSRAVYGQGLTCGIEKDIRYLIHDGVRHEFESEVHNGYSSSFYLVQRAVDGRWITDLLA